MFGFLIPHWRVESVLDVGPEALRTRGVDALILDVDCTLKRYTMTACGPEVTAWLAAVQAAGVRVCLLSNGRGPRIQRFAATLGVPYVAQGLKPLPLGVRRALETLGVSANRAALIGDQIFADIMAGRLAGVYTILVRPMGPEEEPWFTRLKRRPEAWVLRWLDRSGRAPASSPSSERKQ